MEVVIRAESAKSLPYNDSSFNYLDKKAGN